MSFAAILPSDSVTSVVCPKSWFRMSVDTPYSASSPCAEVWLLCLNQRLQSQFQV